MLVYHLILSPKTSNDLGIYLGFTPEDSIRSMIKDGHGIYGSDSAGTTADYTTVRIEVSMESHDEWIADIRQPNYGASAYGKTPMSAARAAADAILQTSNPRI